MQMQVKLIPRLPDTLNGRMKEERYNKIRLLLLADDLVDSFPRGPCRSFEPFFFNEFGDVQVTDTSYGERLVSLIDKIMCT